MILKLENNLKRAIIFSLILNSALAFSGFYSRTYDSYPHMFFADHYQKDWFDTWEPRWYLGFNVASYPPLAHQALALVGFAIGLESAYVIITLLFMVLLPIATFKFAKVFISEEAAGYASLASVFFPGILYSVYVWGQFTTLFSLVITLFTIPSFYGYIRNGGLLRFAELILLFEATIASHHFTGLIFAPLVLLVTFATILVRKETSLKTGLKRFLLVTLVGLLLSTVVLYPVLISAVGQNANIPHATTMNYFENLDFLQLFFINMYGPFLILIPLTVVTIYNRRDLLPLFILSLFLLILGLGGTTPLPQVMFGQSWSGLTYERFNLFAILVFTPLFGSVCASLRGKKFGKTFLAVFLIICILFSSLAASYSFFRPRQQEVPVTSLVDFLNQEDHWRWRYLTLGFESSDFGKLSIYSNATTIDGWYHRGRDIPELANSSVDYLSGAKFAKNGMAELKSILENSSQYHLRFVFCNDAYYESVLNETGFSLFDVKYEQITIWAKYDSTPLEINEIVNAPHALTLQAYSWGIVPMGWLIGLLLLTFFRFLKKHENGSR